MLKGIWNDCETLFIHFTQTQWEGREEKGEEREEKRGGIGREERRGKEMRGEREERGKRRKGKLSKGKEERRGKEGEERRGGKEMRPGGREMREKEEKRGEKGRRGERKGEERIMLQRACLNCTNPYTNLPLSHSGSGHLCQCLHK